MNFDTALVFRIVISKEQILLNVFIQVKNDCKHCVKTMIPQDYLQQHIFIEVGNLCKYLGKLLTSGFDKRHWCIVLRCVVFCCVALSCAVSCLALF